MRSFRRFSAAVGPCERGEAGQTLAEVGLVLAFVAVVCVIAVAALGAIVPGLFTGVLPGFG